MHFAKPTTPATTPAYVILICDTGRGTGKRALLSQLTHVRFSHVSLLSELNFGLVMAHGIIRQIFWVIQRASPVVLSVTSETRFHFVICM